MERRFIYITIWILLLGIVMFFSFRMELQGYHRVANIDGAVLYSENYDTCSTAIDALADAEGNTAILTCLVADNYRVVYRFQTYGLKEALMLGIINIYDIEPYIEEILNING